ncbi:MAG TPA: NADH-quinone oxidoreductase subunit NuoG, partial [Salinisphaeraceae bacterium]|nr:NADH-quinone oxidoreductase subunit NuoG [Salinisphaeraceae bacterium]
MATITIDGKQYEVDDSDNLLQVALSLGYDLPYFCWHPDLDSVGACRQCAVTQYKGEDDTEGTIVMACMTPAADGTRISLSDEASRHFRKEIIEWLMINHPHDCPVCPEGGECHLQDMTVMTQHTQRRYRGRKRTHKNQDLGPFLEHEMNRCIACYRCVRFYRDYADGDDLRVLGSARNVYFGRDSDGPFENEFAGNLEEVCPTGVFTDKTLNAQYVRKWDMQNAPGICGHCSLGCNTSVGSRKGILRRIHNRYHGEINGYFLCDRGRFGAGYATRDDRPRQPLVKQPNGVLEPVDKDALLNELRRVLSEAKGIVGIGSPRASLEDNHGLRQWVGADNFSGGMTAPDAAASRKALELLERFADHLPGMRQVEDCDAVLVLGEDVTQSAPRLALSLRQSVRNKHIELAAAKGIPKWHARGVRDNGQQQYSPMFIATPSATKLDDRAAATIHARPDGIAQLGFAVAHALDADAPLPDNLTDDLRQQADAIASALKGASKPLVVVGTGLASEAILEAAGNVMAALLKNNDDAGLFVTLQEANSLGMAMMDAQPVDAVLAKIEDGSADTLVVMQNDLYERGGKTRMDAAFKAARQVLVIDHSMTETAARADYVLPAGSFTEADGTLINNEGRAQRFFQAFIPDGPMQEAWRWSAELAGLTGTAPDWPGMADIIADIVAQLPQFAGIEEAAPSVSFRKAGMRFPRSPHRFSGRTALYADVNVHEPTPVIDADSPMTFSMEGYGDEQGRPQSLRAFHWAPAWNSNQQSMTRFQDEVGGHLKGGDPGVHLLRASGANGYAKAAVPTSGEWQAVPRYRIFGSEALSARAPAIRERMAKAWFTLNE